MKIITRMLRFVNVRCIKSLSENSEINFYIYIVFCYFNPPVLKFLFLNFALALLNKKTFSVLIKSLA